MVVSKAGAEALAGWYLGRDQLQILIDPARAALCVRCWTPGPRSLKESILE